MRFRNFRLQSIYQTCTYNNLKNASTSRYLPKIVKVFPGTYTQNLNLQSHHTIYRTLSYHCLHTSTTLCDKEETVNVPAFADSVSEGDVRWLKSIGDTVNVDDVVCEIETDKTAVPVPSPFKGTLTSQLVEEGGKVEAHQRLYQIQTDPNALSQALASKDEAQTSTADAEPESSLSGTSSEHAPGTETRGDPADGSFSMHELQTVQVPQFPESVSEGDVKWIKKIGDEVRVDDILCEIETDKTAVPVPSPFDGTLTECLFQDGDKVKSKEALCKIKLPSSKAEQRPPSARGTAERVEENKKSKSSVAGIDKLHHEVSLKSRQSFAVTDGTNIPSGFKQAPQFFPPPETGAFATMSRVPEPSAHSIQNKITGTRTEIRVKMNRMRKRIAERLKEAQNTAAMLTTFNEIDMSTIISLRNKYKDQFVKKHGIKLGFMSPFVMAAVSALRDQPVVNAYISEDSEIVYRDFIDISVAVSTPKGLVVPVMRNCDHMNCADVERSINALGEKARTGNLAIEDMDGGTFTISNGGVFGSLYGTPIINLPQSAILGMHAIVERPVAINNKVEIRPMMYVALTYDHRLIDGREAVTFLRKIKSAVEEPASILLDV